MLLIGKITTTIGLKGFLKFSSYAESIKSYKNIKALFIKNKEGFYNRYDIDFIRNYKKNSLLLSFKETNFESAKNLVGKEIYIEKEFLKTLPENHYYLKDLIGLEVFDKDKYIGKIKQVLQTGANDIYIVDAGDKKEILIPATSSFVLEVNLDEKKMQVIVPELI